MAFLSSCDYRIVDSVHFAIAVVLPFIAVGAQYFMGTSPSTGADLVSALVPACITSHLEVWRADQGCVSNQVYSTGLLDHLARAVGCFQSN